MVALSLAGLVLLLATAAALAVTGALTQPAGTAGCVSQGGVESCADGHGLNQANGVAVSPDGKNVYVASYGSAAVARLDRDPSTGTITQTTGTSGCVADASARCFSGPRAQRRVLGGGEPGRKERLRRLVLQRRRRPPQPQYDHRRDHRARRDRRLHQPGRVGPLRRRACAGRPAGGCGEPGRQERLRRLAEQQRRGPPRPQSDHRGDHRARRDRQLHQR